MEPLSDHEIRQAVQAALAEDVGPGDATTLATIPAQARACAVLSAREPLTVCGLGLAREAFRQLSADCEFALRVREGDGVTAGTALARVCGPARALLTAERVALNFLQRLSGVATLTAQFVQAIQGTPARILDTRKTTPGWRHLEKYAVACGGGHNHRFGLFDLILIKDNHLAALAGATPNPVAAAVARARAAFPNLRVEVEADRLEQVQQALEAGADIILLDNMTLTEVQSAVGMVGGRARTEASGGVTLETVRRLAETGVDFISVGALTHSARAMDIGLDFEGGLG